MKTFLAKKKTRQIGLLMCRENDRRLTVQPNPDSMKNQRVNRLWIDS